MYTYCSNEGANVKQNLLNAIILFKKLLQNIYFRCFLSFLGRFYVFLRKDYAKVTCIIVMSISS